MEEEGSGFHCHPLQSGTHVLEGLAPGRPAVIGSQLGIAHHHRDPIERDVERAGHELGERGTYSSSSSTLPE